MLEGTASVSSVRRGLLHTRQNNRGSRVRISPFSKVGGSERLCFRDPSGGGVGAGWGGVRVAAEGAGGEKERGGQRWKE